MKTRQHTLLDLLYYRVPTKVAVQQLSSFSWDSENTLAVLTREQVAHMLAFYLDNKISAEELEAWANAVEGRDDIGFENEYEEDLQETIHQLANPLLTLPITPENTNHILEALKPSYK